MTPDLPVALLREGLARHGRVHLVARGQSMRPLVPDGSLCEIVRLHAMPRPGQLVAAVRGEVVIVHRVIAVTASLVQTRGDGARRADPPWRAADLLGLVSRVRLPVGLRYAPDLGPVGRAIALVQRFRRKADGFFDREGDGF